MNEEILKSFGSKWGYAPFHGGYLKTSVNYFVFFNRGMTLGFAHPTEQQMSEAMEGAEGAIPISAAGQILLRSIHPEAARVCWVDPW
jgi:hypothetical protein